MAKPGTTHVIEIETGIGEPAFIPLTMGSELQPISVGKKGMWRIESARVLDVHAFVYFDGSSLFLQSADESQAASVDGYRVGKAWTELHAPCHIEIGAARLRFRSLSDAPSDPKPAPPPPSDPRPAAGGPPPQEPTSTNTRVGPVESRPVGVVAMGPDGRPAETTGQRAARGTGQLLSSGVAPVQAIPQSQHPPGLMSNAIMSSSVSAVKSQPGMAMGPMPSGAMNVGPMGGPMGGNPMGGPMGSGGYGAMGGPMGSGGYGAMGGPMTGSRAAPTVQTTGDRSGGGGQGGLDEQIAKFKALTPQKRILVVLAPFCLVAAAYLLLFDDEEPIPTPQPRAVVDAGPATPVTTPIPTAPAPPQCPTGFVPYSVPVNGQYPCVPLGTPMPPPQPGPAPQPQPVPQPGPQPQPQPPGPQPQPQPQPPPGPSAPPMPTGPKTLERQAVDAVAVNDYARAAAIYETLLAQSNPRNPVYAEAARILRQKADAGAPP